MSANAPILLTFRVEPPVTDRVNSAESVSAASASRMLIPEILRSIPVFVLGSEGRAIVGESFTGETEISKLSMIVPPSPSSTVKPKLSAKLSVPSCLYSILFASISAWVKVSSVPRD